MAETASAVDPKVIEKELGLDVPIGVSILNSVTRYARGDLGKSMSSGADMAPLLKSAASHTLIISFASIFISFFAALLLGAMAANKPKSVLDQAVSAWGALGSAVPSPWLGPILALIFGFWLPIFPISRDWKLAVLTLSFGLIGGWSRLIRAETRHSLMQGCAIGARARGLPEWRVVLKHGVGPIAGHLFAYFGTSFGSLLGGAFVIETIFDWPGLGTLLVDAVTRRDYPVVQLSVFLVGMFCLCGTWAGDLCQSLWNRRSRQV